MADLTPTEQAASDVLASHISAKYASGELTDAARLVVAAVRPPIAEEAALELGRDALRDGLTAFLNRLVGPENTARLLAPVAAAALRDLEQQIVVWRERISKREGSREYRDGLHDGLTDARELVRAAAELEQETRS